MLYPIGRHHTLAVVSCAVLAVAVSACGSDSPTRPEIDPPPASGTIEVTVTTSGATLDPDGYSVLVDDVSAGTIEIDGTLTVEVEPGLHEVYLGENAFNCYVEQKEAVNVDVVEDQTVTVPLSVRCVTPLTDRVLYTTPSGDFGTSIVRVSPENSNVSQRVVVGDARHVSLSADGTRMAFQRAEQVYWMWVDGSDLTQVTQGEGREPSLSPDGTRIAYRADGFEGRDDIFVVDVDGSNLRNLTNSPEDESAPAWSPDGLKLAYRLEADDNWIMIQAVDGTAPASALHGITSVILDKPAWSPDGATIAFRRGSEIVAKSAAAAPSADASTLVAAGVDDENTDPGWSPDGQELVYASKPFGGVYKLWVTSVSSGNSRRLFPASGEGGALEIEPVWAPSSNR